MIYVERDGLAVTFAEDCVYQIDLDRKILVKEISKQMYDQHKSNMAIVDHAMKKEEVKMQYFSPEVEQVAQAIDVDFENPEAIGNKRDLKYNLKQ